MPSTSRFERIAPSFPKKDFYEHGMALFARIAALPTKERRDCIEAALEFADGVRDGTWAKPKHWFNGDAFVDALIDEIPEGERGMAIERLVAWAESYSARVEPKMDWSLFGRRRKDTGKGRKATEAEYEAIIARAFDRGVKGPSSDAVRRRAERFHVGMWAEGYFEDVLRQWFEAENPDDAIALAVEATVRSFRMVDRAALEGCLEQGANPANVFGFERLKCFLEVFGELSSKRAATAFESALMQHTFDPSDGDLLARVVQECSFLKPSCALPRLLVRHLLEVSPSRALAQIARGLGWSTSAIRGPLDEGALVAACARKAWRHARELLAAPGSVDRAKTRRERALVVAAENEAPSGVIDALLEKGANIDALGHNGWTALYASLSNRVSAHLLSRGADPNARMKFATGETESALHRAVKLRRKELACRLLEGGARVDAKDWRGATPLWTAVENLAPLSLIEALLERGANPNCVPAIVDDQGPPLWLLYQLDGIRRGYFVNVARALVDAGADPRLRGENKRSAVDHAAAEGPVAVEKLFVPRVTSKRVTSKRAH